MASLQSRMKHTDMVEPSAKSVLEIYHEAQLRYVAYFSEFSEKHRYDYDALTTELPNVLQAADLCIILGEPQQLALFARNLGDYLLAAGQWHRYQEFANALLTANAITDTAERLQLLGRLAEIEQAQGNYATAEHLYRQQLRDIEQLETTRNDIVTHILGRFVKLVLLQGKNAEALRFLTEQLKVSSSPKERVDIILDMVDLFIKDHQFDEAEQMCHEGIRIARSIDYVVGEIDLMRHLATTTWRRGDINRAFELYQTCLEWASRMGDRERLAKIEQERGYLQLMNNRMVFLSYAREDSLSAQKLFDDLRQSGVHVWFDQRSLLGGENWKLAVRQAIRNSRFFVALLSGKSISKKGYVQRELKEALEVLAEYPESQIFLIPVRLDSCNPTNPQLQDIQWVDMFPSWSDGLARIFEGSHALNDDWCRIGQERYSQAVVEAHQPSYAALCPVLIGRRFAHVISFATLLSTYPNSMRDLCGAP